jgi:hypothetical protein
MIFSLDLVVIAGDMCKRLAAASTGKNPVMFY